MKTWILILGLLIVAMALVNVVLNVVTASQLHAKSNKEAKQALWNERNMTIITAVINVIILILAIILVVVSFTGINRVTAAAGSGTMVTVGGGDVGQL